MTEQILFWQQHYISSNLLTEIFAWTLFDTHDSVNESLSNEQILLYYMYGCCHNSPIYKFMNSD